MTKYTEHTYGGPDPSAWLLVYWYRDVTVHRKAGNNTGKGKSAGGLTGLGQGIMYVAKPRPA